MLYIKEQFNWYQFTKRLSFSMICIFICLMFFLIT